MMIYIFPSLHIKNIYNYCINVMKKTQVISELINKQLEDVPISKKLQYNDIKRMSKYISGNIFDENICSLWLGYITNVNNTDKGVYINFYFRGKKAILHRILYSNYVGPLNDNEYLKFTCPNKGKCCNVHHLKKFTYVKKNDEETKNIDVIEKKQNLKVVNTNFTLKFD
jgi:hypothetical protein